MTDDVARIVDLREPQRSEAEQAAYDFGCSLEVALDPDDLVTEARRRTGLDDLGDTGVEDRLRVLCAAVDADTGLSGLGRLIVRRRLQTLLAARLRLEDWVAHHPEALELELEPPVIVVGLPRSGTTHLVNLLAADSRFRSLPWWEIQEPTPVLGDLPGADGIDPRFTRALADHEATLAVAPLTARMHPRHPSVIEEECELMDLDLCSYAMEWMARLPAWRDAYLGFDQDAHYGFLRRQLQVLAHLRGPRRFVLKCPQHLEQLGPLTRTFPDATIAVTHRDPVAVLQSAVTMLAYGDRLRRVAVEPDDLADYWVDRIGRLLDAFGRDEHLLTPERRVDVVFDDFMADELGTVGRVLDAAGLDLTDRARDQLAAYSAAHPRGAEGRMAYDLRGDFHLEPAQVRERFAGYLSRYPQIRPEVT